MRLLALTVVALVLGLSNAGKKGPTIKMKVPGAATISKGAKYSNWKAGKDAWKITPVFNPQLLLDVGTPKQELLGCGMDVSSGDTWIVDINANQPQPAPWLYDPSQSSTFKNSSYPYQGTVADVNGFPATITGTIAEENFVFEGHKFQMRFAMIENVMPVQGQAEIPDVFATGRCGLGFYASDYIDPFLPKVFASVNASDRSLTTVIHDCMLDQDEEEVLTEVAIGFVDDQFCNTSTTVTVPLVDRNNWNFAITGYQIGSMVSTTRQIAKMDTNILHTGVPTAIYNYIFTTTNAKNDPNSPWPIVDCNQQFPKLNFNVTGDSFSVGSHYYVFKDFKDENTPCYLMIYPLEGGGFLPAWSFGYVWMYKKCITLDYGNRAIGFTDYNSDFCQDI